MEIVDDILGFLYDSERYSLYLYLIDETKPIEGKKILVKLYSTIVEEKNERVEEIVGDLNKELTDTIRKSKTKKGAPSVIPKSLKGPKGTVGPVGPKRPKGETELLKAVDYIKQRSNGDGNCFYNSIGMLSSDYLRDKARFDNYDKETTEEKYKIQYDEQSRVRTDLATFMRNIYKIIKNIDKNSVQYKESSIIKYIVRTGEKNDFKYVSKLQSPIGSKYYGTDAEIYFASLYYKRPIVTVTGVSDVAVYNIFYWKYYDINGIDFVDYIKSKFVVDVNEVLDFLSESNEQLSCELDDISVFLMYYPNSYFLVGGTGHWSYAINTKLIGGGDGGGDSDDSSVPVTPVSGTSVGGANSKLAVYNLRVTKKIKNIDSKYYKKSSPSKTTRKHKKTRKVNKHKNNKKNKKTIKYNH